jgi:sugar phosphate isomerase/epimerase
LHDRLLPGDGELPLPALMADLRATGTNAPLGLEVFSDVLHALDPVDAGRLAGGARDRFD